MRTPACSPSGVDLGMLIPFSRLDLWERYASGLGFRMGLGMVAFSVPVTVRYMHGLSHPVLLRLRRPSRPARRRADLRSSGGWLGRLPRPDADCRRVAGRAD